MRKKKRYYALPCMVAIVVTAALVTGAGFVLRHTLLKELPQYADAPDIAIPMMLLQDSGPLREAREREAWEAAQAQAAVETMALSAPTPETREAPQPADNAEPMPTEAAAQAEPEPESTPALLLEETLIESVDTSPADAGGAAVSETPAPPAWDEPEPEAAPTFALEEVPESYFDHTLFIGDSKTDGLRMWGRLGEAQYFCGTSYSVYNIFDKTASDKEFKDARLDTVLQTHTYDQIYITLGYNEAGYAYSSLMKQFKYVIKRVHEAQPQARVILHGVMHASERVARKYDYYTVSNLEKINDGLREMADAYDGLYYVDCNEAFCDENGYLMSHMSTDGEHLTPDYTKQWAQEIRKRAVVVR